VIRKLPPPEFTPPVWARTGHLQTILGAYLPQRLPHYRSKAHVLTLTDGDQIVVHDDCPESWTPGDPCTVLLHGVGGCHRANYLVRTADKLTQRGVRTFRMDQRGVGAGLARSPGHAGRSDDLAEVVGYVLHKCPDSPISVCGFSLGGNIALKYASHIEDRHRFAVKQIIAVAPPVDLTWCSENLKIGLNRLYSHFWARLLFGRTQHWRTEGACQGL